jgi:hypothetical protein
VGAADAEDPADIPEALSVTGNENPPREAMVSCDRPDEPMGMEIATGDSALFGFFFVRWPKIRREGSEPCLPVLLAMKALQMLPRFFTEPLRDVKVK